MLDTSFGFNLGLETQSLMLFFLSLEMALKIVDDYTSPPARSAKLSQKTGGRSFIRC